MKLNNPISIKAGKQGRAGAHRTGPREATRWARLTIASYFDQFLPGLLPARSLLSFLRGLSRS